MQRKLEIKILSIDVILVSQLAPSTSEYDKAIEYYYNALDVAKQIEDTNSKKRESNICQGLGENYYKLGKYDKAIEFTEKSLDMRKRINDKEGKSYNYNTLALIYTETDNKNKAVEYYEKSLSIATETNNRTNEACTYLNMGISYGKLNNKNKAVEYYEKSLSIATEIEDTYTEKLASVNLGMVYNESQPQKAFIYLKRAIEITEETEKKAQEKKIRLASMLSPGCSQCLPIYDSDLRKTGI